MRGLLEHQKNYPTHNSEHTASEHARVVQGCLREKEHADDDRQTQRVHVRRRLVQQRVRLNDAAQETLLEGFREACGSPVLRDECKRTRAQQPIEPVPFTTKGTRQPTDLLSVMCWKVSAFPETTDRRNVGEEI